MAKNIIKENTQELDNYVQKAKENVQNIVPKSLANKVLGSSAGNLASQLPDTLSKFNKTAIPELSKLTQSFNIEDKIPNANKLLNNNTNDISFVSNIVKDNIKPAGFENLNFNTDNLFSFASNQLDTLSKRSGISDIVSDMDLSKAFSNISEQQNVMELGKIEFAGSLYGASKENSSSSFFDSIKDVVSQGAGYVSKGMDYLNEGFDYLKDNASVLAKYSSDAINKLPGPLSGIVKNQVDNLSRNITNGQMQDLLNKLPFVDDVSELYSKFAYGDMSNIISDSSGNFIDGFGRSDFSTSQSLYNNANKLCGSGEFNFEDYSSSKNIYDASLLYMAKNGLSDLLRKAANCPKYYDSRSENILIDSLSTSSRKGDSNTVLAILESLGNGRVPNKSNTLFDTASNMGKYDSVDSYNSLSDMLKENIGTSIQEPENYGQFKVNSGTKITELSKSNIGTKLIDSDSLAKSLKLFGTYAQ